MLEMGDETIPENHQEYNNKVPELLSTPESSGSVKIPNKQTTSNSSSPHNQFDLPSFKCGACPYESIWKHAVKRHQQIHYRQLGIEERHKIPKYKCDYCLFTTNNRLALKNHQIKHVTQCEGKSKTEQNKHLISQEQAHSASVVTERTSAEHLMDNEEEYSDQQSAYPNKKSKKLNTVLDSDKEEQLSKDKYKCDLCSFTSVYKHSFLRHLRDMHGNRMLQNNNVISPISHEDDICQVKKKKVEEKRQQPTSFDENLICQNNNIVYPVESQEMTLNIVEDKIKRVTPNSTVKRQKVSATRRGKYSDVPVKTTKNGLFQCEHCSYQTAIRTAVVKHQTNHLKNSNG